MKLVYTLPCRFVCPLTLVVNWGNGHFCIWPPEKHLNMIDCGNRDTLGQCHSSISYQYWRNWSVIGPFHLNGTIFITTLFRNILHDSWLIYLDIFVYLISFWPGFSWVLCSIYSFHKHKLYWLISVEFVFMCESVFSDIIFWINWKGEKLITNPKTNSRRHISMIQTPVWYCVWLSAATTGTAPAHQMNIYQIVWTGYKTCRANLIMH